MNKTKDRESMTEKSNKVKSIIKILSKKYPFPKTPLKYKSPIQLLVSVILSAQCTDKRVNEVTPALFSRFKTVRDFAECDILELENMIKPTGFYRNKAKNIKSCCQKLISDFSGKIPERIEDLLILPGVGRKTANVILSELYNQHEGIVVDTHVGRLAVRIGLTNEKDSKSAEKIEKDLIVITPHKEWRDLSLYLIFHGREICTARIALCDKCEISKFCNSARKIKEYKANIQK